MNAHQRRKTRRNKDAMKHVSPEAVERKGFIMMVADADPTVHIPTGQLYRNASTGQLRVTLGGGVD